MAKSPLWQAAEKRKGVRAAGFGEAARERGGMQMADVYGCSGGGVTEQDIIYALKSGDEDVGLGVRRRMQSVGRQLGVSEMIELSAMRGCRYDRTRVQESPGDRDGIFSVLESVERLEREQERYVQRELMRASEDAMKNRMIWDGFYFLRDDLRLALKLYYIERKSVEEISEELFISKATFWRRRKAAVVGILRYCEQSMWASDRYSVVRDRMEMV